MALVCVHSVICETYLIHGQLVEGALVYVHSAICETYMV